ncbi:hypothetical protein QTJ16_000238 [Diplocarpon rosae]|uniref:Aminoglycoside phosphotransferase domain-containing protein n=1 Tax=Diplocarpon rosae TaxID=946125 RepID=A0AAD9WGL9_9HELO|nr:hypothetical protein QTJ16_000238 [Diplocarpon rosae]
MGSRRSIILPASAPTNTQSKPSLDVNNTPLRRLFVLATIRILCRMIPRRGPVLMVSKNLCIKVGFLKQPAEAVTMQFIAKHTSIPVPKVYCAFEPKGCKYILMERVEGHILKDDWLERSAESKGKILAQLKDMIDQLRRIPPPSGQGISNVAGGALFDGYGGEIEDASDANRLVEWHNQYCGKPTFTHGDLSILNIIARGDKVVGIIDWETAGWWPEYWEYTGNILVRGMATRTTSFGETR